MLNAILAFWVATNTNTAINTFPDNSTDVIVVLIIVIVIVQFDLLHTYLRCSV